MKVLLYILLLGIIAPSAIAEDKKDLSCYLVLNDKDNDGYAKSGATEYVLQQDKSTQFTCPMGFVSGGGDCDDTKKSVHPLKLEDGFNDRDDNCSGKSDESDLIYFVGGNSNTDTSFEIRVKINNQETLNRIATSYSIYAQVTYNTIADDNDNRVVSPYIKVNVKDYYHDEIGAYKGYDVKVSGLTKATVYSAQIKTFYYDGSSYKKTEDSGDNTYYTTTDNIGNEVGRARTEIILRGFAEFFNQKMGLVGRNGMPWPNGTRYGASLNESWCTEFYYYSARNNLNFLYHIPNVQNMRNYFLQNFVRVNDVNDMDLIHRGDWVVMDLESEGKMTHTAMFLGIDIYNRIVTLDGNTGNKVNVRFRPVSVVYGYGRIRENNLK